MHPIPVSNESLFSLSLCGLLSFHRSDAARCVHDREHVSNVPAARKIRAGVFSRVSAIAPSSSSSLAARSISIAIGTAKAAGPDNRKPGLRVYADFSFHGAAYADAVVFPVRPRGRRRVCLSTSGPEIFHLSSSPMYVYICICVYVHRPLRTGYVALMYHLRRWTRIYVCIYSVCMESMYRRARACPWVYASVKARPVPPVSVARVCYARPGMFPTKLTSPRLDALAMPAQSGIESFPSVAVTA